MRTLKELRDTTTRTGVPRAYPRKALRGKEQSAWQLTKVTQKRSIRSAPCRAHRFGIDPGTERGKLKNAEVPDMCLLLVSKTIKRCQRNTVHDPNPGHVCRDWSLSVAHIFTNARPMRTMWADVRERFGGRQHSHCARGETRKKGRPNAGTV